MNRYLLAFAHPAFAVHYRRDALTAADLARVRDKPALEARAQWQTSRALLARLRCEYPDLRPCLSHKHDHSAVALGEEKPGVDLEALALRDYAALAAHAFSAQESAHIAASNDMQTLFYQYWTVKEALIKAEDLHFPADLRRCGINDGAPYAPSGKTYRWISLLLDETWLLSAVWPARGTHPVHLHLYTPQSVVVRVLGGDLPTLAIHRHRDI